MLHAVMMCLLVVFHHPGTAFVTDHQHAELYCAARIIMCCVECTSKLYADDYVNPDAEAEAVVSDLEGVLAHLEELKAAVETYKEYQVGSVYNLFPFTLWE
jgi:hypothetical protein